MPRFASQITKIPSQLLLKNLKPFPRPISRLSTKSSSLGLATSALTMKVAVIGSGISGAVCAASLAGKGVSVTVFESGRGPGGRTSQRRETTDDGKELLFDHGAPFFTVDSEEVRSLVSAWEARGLVAEWKENFGSFDQISTKFVDLETEGSSKKYVGIPGMNSICKALCSKPGVESKFGVTVGKLDWLDGSNLWSLIGLDGQSLGHFDGVVATDKNIASPRFTGQTGRPPPLDVALVDVAQKLQGIPVRSCFALMLAFSEPLTSIPVKGISFKNSEVLSWAFCDSSKPGRSLGSHHSERWVLHSTAKHAERIITQTGLQKPSNATLSKVAEELFQEFQSIGFSIPQPFFMKAHRWILEIDFLGMSILNGSYHPQPHIDVHLHQFPDVLQAQKQIQQFLRAVLFQQLLLLGKRSVFMTRARDWPSVETSV
ncbi:uncharacterized protein LOC131245066 isoform X2 [Magnolia sinica]|uniref:uncharacterized protein LOC131245066 isoform X2 n=1 Tax=Magnolia sinica TaxID=86752 RepID=UPI00265919DC|nr:uncharacterized protein LOC131245066 isoform X2 [Magnolia sinica]